VLILAGATCSGKTALAIELAQRFGAEIVGADSRQVYRGMPVGTAAPSAAQLAQIPHHLVAFLDPHERYSAARFCADALETIADIHGRGKRAIVVGGTGFYLRALAGDVALSAAYDPALRARLAHEARLHPPEVMHAWLATRDPRRAAAIAPGDRYRVARALEIALAETVRDDRPPLPTLRARGIRPVKFALELPIEALEARIVARVDEMLARGFIDEAERVGGAAVAADAVGYPQALAYLAGTCTHDELRAALVRATRRYAKRQQTWLRSEPDLLTMTAERAAALVQSNLDW